MTTFKQDLNLPSHGKRSKEDNAGTIRIRISHKSYYYAVTLEPDGFDMYLNINLNANAYNATVEADYGLLPDKHIFPVEIANSLIMELVDFVQSDVFKKLNVREIPIPPGMVMDGYDEYVTIRTDSKSIKLDTRQCGSLLYDGTVMMYGGEINTPIHKLAALAYDVLGIKPDDEEIE